MPGLSCDLVTDRAHRRRAGNAIDASPVQFFSTPISSVIRALSAHVGSSPQLVKCKCPLMAAFRGMAQIG